MKIGIPLFILSAALLFSNGCAPKSSKFTVPEPNASERSKLVSFRPPRPERWKLSNGLTVLYVRNPEVPMVSGSVLVRGGGLIEPKFGVGAALGHMMSEGGAGDLSADDLDRELETLSANLSSSVGAEFSSVNFNCLSSDVDRVLALMADVTLRPRFEQQRLSLWKNQSIEDIRRRTDEPWTVAQISFGQLAFGSKSPYGRSLVKTDVSAITRDDLIKFHKQLFVPDGGYLTVTGDIDRSKLQPLIEKYFGNWKPNGRPWPQVPLVTYTPQPGIYFIELPLSQASVYIGQQGVPRLTPDMISIDGFNQLFGSGFFGARLSRKIRSELGLAYVIFGGVMPGPVKGKTLIAFQTKGESVGQAIEASLNELLVLRNDPPTVDELNEVKRSVSNSFIFRFDTLESAASRTVNQEILGYPADYDDTYVSKIEALTPQDIQLVALNRWDLSKFVIVVVGNGQAYQALEAMLKNAPTPLKGMPLRKMKFDQILKIP